MPSYTKLPDKLTIKLSELFKEQPIQTITWKVNSGSKVLQNQVICVVVNQNGKENEVSSPRKGVIGKVSANEVLIHYCSHHVVLYGLCAECGEQVSEIEAASSKSNSLKRRLSSSAEINISGGHRVKLSGSEVEKKSGKTTERLIKAQKLILILDLDHTILHATNQHSRSLLEAEDVHQISLTVGRHGVKQPHLVKIRPGLKNLLETLKDKFEMYVYTHGTREYAMQVLKLFDPEGVYVGHRVLTRSDEQHFRGKGGHMVSKDLSNLFPADDSMVVILDDREDVWKLNTANLITLRPYKFFVYDERAQINNAAGPEYVGSPRKDSDKVLRHVLGLLLWIHKHFYAKKIESTPGDEESTLDVKKLLSQLRKRILRNVTIFLHEDLFPDSALPKGRDFPSLVETATQLGADVVSDVSKLASCSHILCSNKLKPNETMKNEGDGNALVLAVEWLLSCSHGWWREVETSFSLPISVSQVRDLITGKTVASDGLEEESNSDDNESLDDLTAFIES